MKKKLLIIFSILIILIVGVIAVAGTMNSKKTLSSPSEYKIGISYSEAIKSDKPALVLFYVNWCGYCLRFMPKFKALNDIYGDKYNFVMFDVESSLQNTMMAKQIGISGFPTVYIIDSKYDNRVLLPNAIYQDNSKFKAELDRYLRIRGLLDSK